MNAVNNLWQIRSPFTLERMRRVSAKDARLGGMSMNNIRLQFPQDVLDLKIRRYVVMRIYLASQVIEDDEIKFLVLRKLV